MIYYKDEAILVRTMVPEDARIITEAEIAQGWQQTIDKYEMRLRHQAEKQCVALVVEWRGSVAGYIHLYPCSGTGPAVYAGCPEIVDFGVLEKARGHGVGSRLMDVAEQLALEYGDRVYLAVGLHSGYGSAQRMYVKRGYIPDGSGVWYRDRILPPGAACCNDDDLVLYMSKTLSRA